MQCSPMLPGGFPSLVSDAVGLDAWSAAWPLLLGSGVLGGRTVCGGFFRSPVSRVHALCAVSVVRCGRRSLRWERCSTTPGELYWWPWALVRGSRPAGGVSPFWRAAAACERPRRACPGEIVG